PYLFDHFDSVQELLSLAPFGLFTDFDGTISDIEATPGEAHISPICHHHLTSLSEKIAVLAIVSGRPVKSLVTLSDIQRAVYVGNHGLERLEGGRIVLQPGAEKHTDVVRKALEMVKEGLAGLDGIVYEDKGPVMAVHYRGADDRAAAEARILSLLQDLSHDGSIQVGQGRMVVEIRPPVIFSKGAAVLELISKRSLTGGIYLGDDLTDLDAIRVMRRSERGNPFVGVGVAVVGEETPPQVVEAADCTLDGPRDVERFLKWLDEAIS
ncbi:MAG: trehalose-phosphatase, partial [Dehalococcoidia bacterium]